MGNRIETILPSGESLQWHYAGAQNLQRITLEGKTITSYQRDALYREISRSQESLTSLSEYDSVGRLIKQVTLKQQDLPHVYSAPQHITPVVARRYSYDATGELLSIQDRRKGKFVYGYDAIGRIIHAHTPSIQERFAFDPAHNLIEEGDFNKTDNRIYTYQDKRYTYDSFGNMQSKKISHHTHMEFGYNLEHQMTEATVTKNKVTQIYTYGYDPFGRRVSKTDAFGTTYFTWDGNRLLCESRGTKTQSYIYEQEGFVPVATLDQDQNIRYYHTDHLGTPQELTNTKGEIVWEAEYVTWGNTVKVNYKQLHSNIKEQDEVALQPLRFQGQYHDQETGLHYNRFRYYDPDVGRFTTLDPIGLLGGDNLYVYAANPMGWVDPLGLAASDLTTISPNTKEWREAVEHLSGLGKGKANYRVKNATDAKKLLKESRGNMNRYKQYQKDKCKGCVYKKGYEVHNDKNPRELEAGNDLQHLNWKDGKAKGHIYYNKPN